MLAHGAKLLGFFAFLPSEQARRDPVRLRMTVGGRGVRFSVQCGEVELLWALRMRL